MDEERLGRNESECQMSRSSPYSSKASRLKSPVRFREHKSKFDYLTLTIWYVFGLFSFEYFITNEISIKYQFFANSLKERIHIARIKRECQFYRKREPRTNPRSSVCRGKPIFVSTNQV